MAKKLPKNPPRINAFKADIRETPFKERQRVVKSVTLDIINFDEEYKKDLKEGKGFLITNEEDFNEKTGTRTMDGLYSPIYGISSFSDKITDDYYRCDCGETTGSLSEGDICPNCGTEVQFIDTGLDVFGYIPLGNFIIINPAMYTLLAKLIGEKDLQLIIKFNNKYNVSGKNVSTKTKSSPYHGIGIIKFKEDFDEIVSYYRDKRKQPETYDIIMKFKDSAFAHHIPVYSSLLRPLVKDDSKISMVDDNKSYSIILANANSIRSSEIPGVDKTIIFENSLFEIQSEFNKIYKDIIDLSLSTKKGVIRGQVTCNRVDYSGRCVIVPATGHSVDEVSMPYAMGVEMMRPLIIRALSKTKDISVREANSEVDAALRRFNKGIWFIMNHIIMKSHNPPQVMVQRSPSLLQESMRLMRIKCIKPDFHDLTLDVPTGILDYMGADFN